MVAATAMAASAVTAGSCASVMTPSAVLQELNYSDVKARSAAYRGCKALLHTYFESPRNTKGVGGMGQRWLSRRTPLSSPPLDAIIDN